MGTGYTRNDTADNIADGKVIDAADLDGEFNAIEAAFVASTGHTHDGTAAEGGPITVLGPAQEYIGGASDFTPKTTNTYDLGSASLQWKDLYVDGVAYLDSVDIDAGAIDGTPIGANSASTGAFTTLSASGVATIDLSTISSTGDLAVADGGTGAGTAAGARTNLGLVIGTDVQAYDAGLADIAGLAVTDGNFIVGNGTNWVAESGATVRTSLGLGSIATQASTNVNIDGGNIDGTIIGASSAAAGTFTSLDTSGSVRFGGTPNGLANNPRATISATSITATYDYSAQTELVVTRDGDCRITIAADSASSSVLSFADQASETTGQIEYDHATDEMIFRAGASDVATLSAGELLVNDRVNIQGSTPELLLDDTAAGVNEGVWRIALDSTNAYFQTRTDANGAGENYHVITRSGTGVTQQTFGIGGATKLTLSSSGAQLASGATVDTIETTLTDDDTHLPTSGAVVDHVASLALGVGQTWQDVSGSRAASTSYQNTTGKPIMVAVVLDNSSGTLQVSTDNATWITVGSHSGTDNNCLSAIVPDDHYYRVTGGATIVEWAELR